MKECIQCGKSFEEKRATAQYCSTACRVMYNRKDKANKIDVTPALNALAKVIFPTKKTGTRINRDLPPDGLDKPALLRWFKEHK